MNGRSIHIHILLSYTNHTSLLHIIIFFIFIFFIYLIYCNNKMCTSNTFIKLISKLFNVLVFWSND